MFHSLSFFYPVSIYLHWYKWNRQDFLMNILVRPSEIEAIQYPLLVLSRSERCWIGISAETVWVLICWFLRTTSTCAHQREEESDGEAAWLISHSGAARTMYINSGESRGNWCSYFLRQLRSIRAVYVKPRRWRYAFARCVLWTEEHLT